LELKFPEKVIKGVGEDSAQRRKRWGNRTGNFQEVQRSVSVGAGGLEKSGQGGYQTRKSIWTQT